MSDLFKNNWDNGSMESYELQRHWALVSIIKNFGENAMLIDLGELSNGLGMFFIREFMETAEKMFCDEGQVLFRSGEATHNFYTLIQGELNLYIGTNAQHVYTVNHAGDVFGWSSLVGGTLYSATAVCSKPSELLIFDSDLLARLLKRYPESGFLFYKKLAETLGKRLLKAYQVIQGEEALVPQSELDSRIAL